jgi:hypothetical protein
MWQGLVSDSFGRQASRTNRHQRQSLAGFSVGVIVAEAHYELLKGNMQHAATFEFPVLFGVVPDVTAAELFSGSDDLCSRVIAVGHTLLQQGVRAIAGACGSFAYFQTEAVKSFAVPTAMSIMTQLPFLLRTLPEDRKLGVIFHSLRSFTPRLQRECGIFEKDLERLATVEASALPAFRDYMAHPSRLDVASLRLQLREQADELVRADPSVAAIVLQCSDLPPFASDIREVTGLPVFDGTLLVRWLHAAASLE